MVAKNRLWLNYLYTFKFNSADIIISLYYILHDHKPNKKQEFYIFFELPMGSVIIIRNHNENCEVTAATPRYTVMIPIVLRSRI